MTFVEKMPAKTRFVIVTLFVLTLCLFLLMHSILTSVPQNSSVDTRPLYSSDAISSAQEIEITTSEAMYTLVRSGDAWTLREKAGFPFEEQISPGERHEDHRDGQEGAGGSRPHSLGPNKVMPAAPNQ